jgi:5-deoxy-glucuronate isomerase
MKTKSDMYLPAEQLRTENDLALITPEQASWTYCGLHVFELEPGGSRTFATGTSELVVLPLSGSCTVEAEGHRFELQGRPSVFERVSDFAYLPIDTEFRVTSATGGEFAMPAAEAKQRLEPAYGAAENVKVEVRGAGSFTRQVNNYFTPDAFPAENLISVEVLIPAGNFAGWPPHKHDEVNPETGEAVLEEIYYFRVRGEGGLGFHRQYTTDGEFDVTSPVYDGDVYLTLKGYHGPSTAVPGYDLYFLNVLAGLAEGRTMAVTDDPDHRWIKETSEESQDDRLPMTSWEGALK